MAFFTRTPFGRKKRPQSAVSDGLWKKCDGCKQTVYQADIEENMQVCPNCGHHYRIQSLARIELLVDSGSFEMTHANITADDPLEFSVGKETYAERIGRARKQSGLNEALVTGMARIEGVRCALGCMDSTFVMASMGSAVGEKFCRLVKDAIVNKVPLIMISASGGARMQEGILALMQMAKTADAVRQINEAGLPYIVVQTDPTSGGVFASFANLGDVTIAEPKAYIGFAGARLIEGAFGIKLPEGFQRAEYQRDNGFVDEIVTRPEMRAYLGKLLRYLAPSADKDLENYTPEKEELAMATAASGTEEEA
ncbi:MAG: acetyl-CoA carboxylase, carboxyltransferase subunit beta [Candidatus Hydrogenedentes bacterium]|nr:acetyl-CoA carboxylase, carboxyltransferase subunit beta [Candidatus Hydrogenedentota bacterium]